MNMRILKNIAASVLLAVTTVATAQAATTLVASQGAGGAERCLIGGANGKCSGGAYNNALSLVSVFQNDLGAGYTLTRVDDSFDKLWMNAVNNGGEVQALARYAGDNSTFGYNAGSGYVQLTGALSNTKVRVNSATAYTGDTKPGDFVVAPDAWTTIPLAANVPFAFVLNDPVKGLLSSNNAVGTFDNMVTFQVSHNNVAEQHFFLAFEDRGSSSDKDYNDYIVEVRFAAPVPEPEIYAMMGLGLGLLGWVGRRRQKA